MTHYKNLREVRASIQGNIVHSEKTGNLYKLTIHDMFMDDDISFLVQANAAEDILHSKDKPFRFTGSIKYDYDEQNNKRSNVDFKMEEYQVLEDISIIEAIDKIRGMNIKFPDNLANNLIKDRYED